MRISGTSDESLAAMGNTARTDGFVFYSLASISFLESTVGTYVANLEPFFRNDPETRAWLRDVWRPEESAHGGQTRAYVLRTWPEFEWARAYARFLEAYAPRCDHELLRPSAALE